MNLSKNYIALTEGRMSRSEFLRQARQSFPNLIGAGNNFEDALKILTRKGLINEELIYQNKADKFPLESIERGIRYELEVMDVFDVHHPSQEQYKKARQRAIDNLGKDPLYYINRIAGGTKELADRNQKEVDNNDQMKKVEAGTKHTLKEGKYTENISEDIGYWFPFAVLASYVIGSLLGYSIYGIASNLKKIQNTLKSKKLDKQAATVLKKFLEDLNNDSEFQQWKSNKKRKLRDLEKIVNRVCQGPNEKIVRRVARDIWQKSQLGTLEEAPTEDNTQLNKKFLDLYIKYKDGNYQVKDKESGELKPGKKLAPETAAQKACLVIRKSMNAPRFRPDRNTIASCSVGRGKLQYQGEKDGVPTFNYAWSLKEATKTVNDPLFSQFYQHFVKKYKDAGDPNAELKARKDAKGALARYKAKQMKEQQEKAVLKEHIINIVGKVLNEAATANLAQLSDENASVSELPGIINNLENVVTEIESFWIKEQQKIQGIFDQVGNIKNEDGLPVGYKFVQPIIDSLKKDLDPVLAKITLDDLKLPEAPAPDQTQVNDPNVEVDPNDPNAVPSVEPKQTVFSPAAKKLALQEADVEKVLRNINNLGLSDEQRKKIIELSNAMYTAIRQNSTDMYYYCRQLHDYLDQVLPKSNSSLQESFNSKKLDQLCSQHKGIKADVNDKAVLFALQQQVTDKNFDQIFHGWKGKNLSDREKQKLDQIVFNDGTHLTIDLSSLDMNKASNQRFSRDKTSYNAKDDSYVPTLGKNSKNVNIPLARSIRRQRYSKLK